MAATNKPSPTLRWDGKKIYVSLPIPPEQGGGIIDASWELSTVSVVRIREAGTETWSPGFETPLTHFTLVGLKPDTEYEMQVTYKNYAGEGAPAIAKIRTLPDGSMNNIIPFPKK